VQLPARTLLPAAQIALKEIGISAADARELTVTGGTSWPPVLSYARSGTC